MKKLKKIFLKLKTIELIQIQKKLFEIFKAQ